MQELRAKARALLEGGAVKLVVGYAAGTTADRARPVFVRQPEQAEQLILNERCRQNLAVYAMKPEVRSLGKPAIVARPPTLRTILQYAVENQIGDDEILALAVSDDGKVAELANVAAIEEYLAVLPRGLSTAEKSEMDLIWQMPRTDRWAFWRDEFSRCTKCYACRAACPLCYCNRCVVDCNQPQWIPVPATELGSLEWHVVRAMHLAGRCIDCGSCAAACPVGIRLDLLNNLLAEEVLTHFGAVAGYSKRKDYALATFKTDDKEDFIR